MTDTAGKPSTDGRNIWLGLDVKPEGIPYALKAIDQWVLWLAIPKPNGSVSKEPYQPNGKHASSTDLKTWADFSTILAAYKDEEQDPPWSGVGFALIENNGITVLDFDHVRDGHSGFTDEDVLGAIKWLDTYAEISPSGTGIRVIGYGSIPQAVSGKALQAWNEARYVTITGHHVPGTPTELRPLDPVKLASVFAHFSPESTKPPPQGPLSGPMIDQAQCLEIRQALGYIPPDESYDTWLQCGMALASTGAPNAFGLWNEWSAGGDKYDAKEMRKKWASFRGDGVQLATLFGLAQSRGWVNPASREAAAFEKAVGMSIDQANRRRPAPVIFAPEKAPTIPFPVPGLDDVCRWFETSAPVSYPVVTQHAVLSLIGAAASRRYVTENGDPLSLYLGASARSIGELRYAHHAGYRAMEAAGLRRMVRNTRISSPASLYKSLLRSPALLYQSDDYGGLTAFARRQPSGLQEAVMALLAQVYDGKPLPLDHADEAGLKSGSFQDEQPVFYAPCVSLFALVGNDHLVTLLRSSELGRGALEQMLLAIADENDATFREPVDSEAPFWLCAHLRSIRGVSESADLDLASIFQGNALLLPSPSVVKFSVNTSGVYQDLDAVSQERALRPVLLAARGIVRRVSACLAVWRDPVSPVVDEPILEWTGQYVAARLREMAEQYEVLHGDDGKSSVYDHVLARIRESGPSGMAKRDLTISCKPFRNLEGDKRGKLIEQMLADELVKEIETSNARGPKGKRLVHIKFIKKEALDG